MQVFESPMYLQKVLVMTAQRSITPIPTSTVDRRRLTIAMLKRKTQECQHNCTCLSTCQSSCENIYLFILITVHLLIIG